MEGRDVQRVEYIQAKPGIFILARGNTLSNVASIILERINDKINHNFI